jgi:plasmid stabilization system protein ParE
MVRLDYSADAVADDYLTGLEAACGKLQIYPEMAAIYSRIRPEIRCLTYRSHRIFYRLSAGAVLIVRILHHAQDVKRVVG